MLYRGQWPSGEQGEFKHHYLLTVQVLFRGDQYFVQGIWPLQWKGGTRPDCESVAG